MVEVAPEEAPRSSGPGQGRSATLVGVLIVVVSIFGAYVTWRAAAASGTAADLDQRARQSSIQAAQLRAQSEAIGAYERRLFVAYGEHIRLAELYESDAYLATGAQARRLTVRAQHERGLARSLELMFYAALPYDDTSGELGYQEADAQTFVEDDPAVEDLAPQELEDAAGVGRGKAFWLVAVDTVLIAAIFFSTLALLGEPLRRRLAAAGLALGVAGGIGFLVVIIAIDVPAP